MPKINFDEEHVQGLASIYSEEELEEQAEKAISAEADGDLYGLEGTTRPQVVARLKEVGKDSARGKKLIEDFEVPEFVLDEIDKG
jgi:hypothetical protein